MRTSNILLIVLVVLVAVLAGLVLQRQGGENFELPEGETRPASTTVNSNDSSAQNFEGTTEAEADQGNMTSENNNSSGQSTSGTSEKTSASQSEILVTDGTKHSIPLDEIVSGGVPKDGIPSIDNPQFISADKAGEFLVDGDFGIGIEHKDDARFYPFKILVWHEIVNDWVAGDPFAITYCPLCLTGVVFEREIENEPVEFGVSGKLYNNNLLMYNRAEKEENESLWSQAIGRAVVGPHTGTKLEIVPSDNISFGDWKKKHPDTKVLSRKTGFSRSYGRDPYGNYYTSDRVLFPSSNTDERLDPKAEVLGVTVNGAAKAYPKDELGRAVLVNDTIGDTSVVAWQNPDTGVNYVFTSTVDEQTLTFERKDGTIVDRETGSEWNWEGQAISGELEGSQLQEPDQLTSFWFAWVAFHPDTGLFQVSQD